MTGDSFELKVPELASRNYNDRLLQDFTNKLAKIESVLDKLESGSTSSNDSGRAKSVESGE